MQIYMITLLCCTLTSVSSMNSLQLLMTDQAEELITSALTSMILNFYVEQSNNIFVTSNKIDSTHHSILQKMFATLDRSASVTWILHDSDYLYGNIVRISNIILIDSYESFRLILKSTTTTSFDHYGYYTVVLTNNFKDRDFEIISSILRDCWQNDIVNVNILLYSEASVPAVLQYTYFPFAPSHCGKIVPVIWNSFENGHIVQKNKQLFPLKTKNLFQCPIPILVAPLRPYISVTQNNSDATHDFEGMEYNLLLQLSKRMNFKLNLTVYWDTKLGTLYENGSADGCYRMVMEKKYSMFIGAMILGPHLKERLSSTIPYSYDSMTLAVPNSVPYSSFEILFFPFKLPTWILISVTLGVAVTAITVLQLYKREYFEFVVGSKNVSPYLNLFNVLLTGGSFSEPRKSFAKFLLMLWILTCLILRTVYQGKLFSFMKMNKMKPGLDSVDELIEQGILIKIIEANYLPFMQFDIRLEKLLKFVDSNSTWEYVTETEAYVAFESQLVDEVIRKHHERQFVPKPKNLKIFSCAHIIYLSKRFYLRETLDDEIACMNENGMTLKWMAPYKESAILNYDDGNSPRKLNISHLVGVFEVWFSLLILASIVFIYEIFSKHWIKKIELFCRWQPLPPAGV